MPLDHVVALGFTVNRAGERVFRKSAGNIQKDAMRLDQRLKATSRTAGGLGGKMALLAGGAFGALGVIAAFKKSTSAAIEFQAAMTKIETLVGVNADTVAGWTENVRELSTTTTRTSQELAEALFVVTSAGERGEEALEILEQAAKAAATGLGETKEIARTVTAAMQAWGKESLSASAATDVLVATVREGNLEASDLAGSLGRVLGTAAKAGVSFAEVGGFIATFTRLGVESSEAVTSLRALLSKIIKPTKDANEALDLMGTSAEKLRASIRDKGLAATLIDLVQLSSGFGEEVITRVIPNIRALAGLFGVTGAQAEAFLEIERKVINSTGILGAAFERWNETPQAAVARMKATIDALRISVGEQMLPVVAELAEKLTILLSSGEGEAFFQRLGEAGAALVDVLIFLIENIDAVILGIKIWLGLKLLNWLVPATSAVYGLAEAVAVLGGSQGLKLAALEGNNLAKALLWMGTPLGALTTAIVAVAGVTALWIKDMNDAHEAMLDDIEEVQTFKDVVTEATDRLKAFAKARKEGLVGDVHISVEEYQRAAAGYEAIQKRLKAAASEVERLRAQFKENTGVSVDSDLVTKLGLGSKGNTLRDLNAAQQKLNELTVEAEIMERSMIGVRLQAESTAEEVDKLGGTKDKLESLRSVFTDLIGESIGLRDAAAEGTAAFRHEEAVLQAMADIMKGLGDNAENYSAEAIRLAGERLAAIREETEALKEMSEAREAANAFAPEPIRDFGGDSAAFQERQRRQAELEAFPIPLESMQREIAAMQTVSEKAKEQRALFGDVNMLLSTGAVTAEEAAQYIAQMTGEAGTFQTAVDEGILNWEQLVAAIKEGPDAVKEFFEAQKKANEAATTGQEKFTEFSQEVQVAVARAFADIITGAREFGDAMTEIFSQLGGALGQALGGPAGQIIGSAAGALIGDALFGGPSTVATGRVGQGGFSASGDQADALTGAFEEFNNALEEIEDLTGGSISLMESLKVKMLDNGEVVVQIAEGYKRQFGDLDAAMAFIAERLLNTADLTGIDADIANILRTSGGDIEQALSDVAFALGIARDALSPFEQELQDLVDEFREATVRAQELGLSLGQLSDNFLRDIGSLRDDILGIEKSDLQQRRERAIALNAMIEAEIAAAQVEIASKQAQLEAQLALVENRALIEEVILRNMQNFNLGFIRFGIDFSNSMGQFLVTLQASAEQVAAIQNEIARLQDFVVALEALKINLADIKAEDAAPVETGPSKAEQLRDQFESAFGSFTAFDSILESLFTIGQTADQLRSKVDNLELSSEDAARALAKITAAEALQIEQIRQNVLGQLLGYLSEEAAFNQQRADLAKAQLDLEFAMIEAQLQALGIWEQFADTFNAAYLAGIDAIREAIDGAADGLRELIEELKGANATPAIGFTQARSEFEDVLADLLAGDATAADLTESANQFLDIIDEVFGTTAAGKAFRDMVLAGLEQGLDSLPSVSIGETIDEQIRTNVQTVADNIDALEKVTVFNLQENHAAINEVSGGISGLQSSSEILAGLQEKGDSEIVSTLIEMMDQNGDGQLSIAEAIESGMSQQLAELLDVNKDGWITTQEITDSILRRGEELDSNVLRLIDTNHDGFIDATERIGFMSDELADKLDANRDGLISLQELVGLDTNALLQVLDTNKDSQLQLHELNFLISNGMFDRLDANNDGVLNLVELGQLNVAQLDNLAEAADTRRQEDLLSAVVDNTTRLLLEQEHGNTQIADAVDDVAGQLKEVKGEIATGNTDINRNLQRLL